MKRNMIFGAVLASSLVLVGCASTQQAGDKLENVEPVAGIAPLTTHDITALSQAGISDSVIIALMKASDSQFTLSTNDVIALADSGVSNTVINAMVVMGSASRRANQPNIVYAFPPYYVYDPFWYSWYYPNYYPAFGFRSYGFHGGGRRFR